MFLERYEVEFNFNKKKIDITNIEKKSKITLSGFTQNPDLDLRRREPMFPEKLAKANQMMRISGMPNIELLTQMKEANQNSDVILNTADLTSEHLNGKTSNTVSKAKKTDVLPKTNSKRKVAKKVAV
jgi:hypothetical protein